MIESIKNFILAPLAGLLAGISPCILPLIPIVVASGLRRSKVYPIYLSLGFVVSFVAMGVGFSAFGNWIGLSKSSTGHLANLLLLLMGLVLLFPGLQTKFRRILEQLFQVLKITNINTSARLGMNNDTQSISYPISIEAFFAGLLLGVVWVPCVGAILASGFALASQGSVYQAGAIMGLFGIGAAIPLLVFSYASTKLLASRQSLERHGETLQKIFGVILIFTAIAIEFDLFAGIQTMLSPLIPDWMSSF